MMRFGSTGGAILCEPYRLGGFLKQGRSLPLRLTRRARSLCNRRSRWRREIELELRVARVPTDTAARMPSSSTLNSEEKDKIKKAIQSGKASLDCCERGPCPQHPATSRDITKERWPELAMSRFLDRRSCSRTYLLCLSRPEPVGLCRRRGCTCVWHSR